MTTGINLGSVDIRRTTMGQAGLITREPDRLGIAKIGRIHDRLMRAATGGLCGFDADGELVLAGHGYGAGATFGEAREIIDALAANGWRRPDAVEAY